MSVEADLNVLKKAGVLVPGRLLLCYYVDMLKSDPDNSGPLSPTKLVGSQSLGSALDEIGFVPAAKRMVIRPSARSVRPHLNRPPKSRPFGSECCHRAIALRFPVDTVTASWGNDMAQTDWPREPLSAETMQVLDRILSDWCAEHSCDKATDEGQVTAKMLVDWFEFGIHDEQELARLLPDPSMLELKTPGRP
ncbi:hypothetical protein AB4Z25_12120 [Rhizobium sp. RAF36]|uniref:hypothetical protein n=1 Tax=Rhizobium sp. RAF36 TaxID=3233055 RepID=UPI003F9D9079